MDPTPYNPEATDAPFVAAGWPSHFTPLRAKLVAVDWTVIGLAWIALPFAIGAWNHASTEDALVASGVAAVTTAVAIWAQHLYWARVCEIRSVEMIRLGQAVLLGGIAIVSVVELTGTPAHGERLAIGGLLALLGLVRMRGFFRLHVRALRTAGHHLRDVVVVGTNDEGCRLVELLHTQPELGYRVVGIVGSRRDAVDDVPWLGDVSAAYDAIRSAGAQGVVIAATALTASELNQLVRQLLAARLNVQVSVGLRGVAAQRVRTVPLSYEPLFYVEGDVHAPWQLLVKRVMDVVVSVVVLALALPFLLIAAAAIKVDDGGPVLYRQERVGFRRRRFSLLKLRTMHVGADAHLDELRARNERDGPLFKLEGDPRMTRVGRVLRSASMDELPQLLNVLRGEMSLVGPRPPLPEEVDHFDSDLQGRFRMPPGITGLWQVEARDNPAFRAYRRLDLFYVENWTLALDFAILVSTIEIVYVGVFRSVRSLLRRHDRKARQQQSEAEGLRPT